ncbi:UNVERIFIED_CONTAM: hypothetical protein FKN15_028103 [Acipenser sinensis]
MQQAPRPTVAEEEAGAEGQQAAGLVVVEKEAEAESQGNKEAQFGNEKESVEEGSLSLSSCEFEFEEEGVADQRKRPVKCKPEEEKGFDKKRKSGVSASHTAELSSGGTPESETMEESGDYVDSPASSSRGQDIVRYDFEGVAFLQENDIASFVAASAVLSPAEDKTPAEEEQQSDDRNTGESIAGLDTDKVQGEGVTEGKWEEGRRKKKGSRKKEKSDVLK